MQLAALDPIRLASRKLVRHLGFMQDGIAGTELPPSAVHALIETDLHGTLTAGALADLLVLDKSSVSRLVRKLVEACHLKEEPDDTDGRVKRLSLTPAGKAVVAEIHEFARMQVAKALARMRPEQHQIVADGLHLYANALAGDRLEVTPAPMVEVGYHPGTIGRCIEMHAIYYARSSGFGQAFEETLAAGLAEFSRRLSRPGNQLWRATRAGQIMGTIAIDGEDLGSGLAHLRWFIVEERARGTGIGRALLSAAIRFCDARGFPEVHLWTFEGLAAARHLYETHGFALVEERVGRQWGEKVMEQRFVRRL